jgi:superfamily II DNA or RNA helicase
MSNTLSTKPYLGNKGYTIMKKSLTEKHCNFIKEQLMIKPDAPGQQYGVSGPKFPIYRESANKFYLPRYFGEEHFGQIETLKITEGDDINVPFVGTLRENQVPVVKAYMDKINEKKQIELDGKEVCFEVGGGGLLELPCAYGKTILSINIISQLKKKTLIIVHKEFLLNQWIERMAEFLPSARIGKIQGQTIDIENKDVVIGMLQSLSQKDYPDGTFDSFGLLVIDEVHHISSEVFSRALFKIVTKYTLGLSATMDRKDGTSFVFKLFLGDVVFKGERTDKFEVVVRAIEYISNDEEFNAVETDFRGNVKYSTMIVKLCSYNPRNEFILRVLSDLLTENKNQQIMILAHNRSLLEYFYEAISTRNIATVGYYVGGMKESALKQSETKQVIVATFAMAAEALDIKTLTTLIMATPKTEIEQAVGRILRQKHGSPIVVDIIDNHEIFKNQWRKRRVFYKKENYRIMLTTSDKYVPDSQKWIPVFVPRKVGDSIIGKKQTSDKKCLLNIGNINFDEELF